MFLFGLEGSGFIISLALTLLMSGAIMFYCLKRFNVLENSILEQGRVLQSFIIRTQQGGMSNSQCSMPPPGLATDIALKSAIEQSANHESNKIEVSDDDDEDDDEDDDDDDDDDDDEQGNMEEVSSTGSTTDSDNNDRIIYDTIETPINLHTEDIETVKTDIDDIIQAVSTIDILSDKQDSVKIVSIEDITPNLLNFELDNASETSESDTDLTDKIDIEQVPTVPSEKIEVSKKPPLSKMKVEQLRSLIIESGKEDIDAVKKLKKDELIKLLQ